MIIVYKGFNFCFSMSLRIVTKYTSLISKCIKICLRYVISPLLPNPAFLYKEC